MSIRYTDKLGMVFSAASEDHRKPNIIRGNGGGARISKSPKSRNNNIDSSFRQAISSVNSQSVSSFPLEPGQIDNVQSATIEEGQLEDDGSSSNEVYISDDFHQLIQPSEISHDDENIDQLVHGSIQTESGNFIVVIRDNKIISMHPQSDEDGVDAEATVVEESPEYLEETTDECEEVESSNIGGEEIMIGGPISEVDDLFIETDNSTDGDNGSASISIEGQVVDLVSDSNGEVQEQYVMIQLPDGNNYLIPASSLEGSSIAVDSTCGNQVFMNENGDHHQIIQVLNSNSDLDVQRMPSPATTTSSYRTMSKARKREYIYESTTPRPTKRIQTSNTTNGTSNGRHLLNTTKRRQELIPVASSQVYPQQKPLPQSRSSAATASSTLRKKPVEDLKPRPFRFDMPEDEIITMDPSTDYLSQVIQQFQKENYHQK